MNEGTIVTRGDDRIGVGGLVYVGGREAAYDAVAGATLRLIINHTPDLVEEAAARGAHVYLCGHTHGGQVVFGGIIPYLPHGKLSRKYASGLFRLGPDGERAMVVSNGVGCSTLPVRFGARAQVHILTIG